jgi:hypothetical protein
MANNRFEELIAKQFDAAAPKKEEVTESTEQVKENTEAVVEETVATEEAPKEETVEAATEEKQEESSLNTENKEETPEVSETLQQSEEVPTTEPSYEFEDLLIEKSNGKFTSYDDVVEAMEALEKSSQNQFANEQIENLNNYVANGGDIMDFLTTQLTDYESMSDEQLVKAMWSMNEKDLTGEEVGLLFEDTYKLDEEQWASTEVKLAKIKLKRDAKSAKEELSNLQKQNSIPKSVANNKEQIEAQEKAGKEWIKKVELSARQLKTVDVDVNEQGDKFSYAIPEETVKSVRKSNKDLNKFWSRYIKEDGTEDMASLNRDMAILSDFDNIVRAVYSQARSTGKETVVKDLKNPSYTPESKPKTAEAKLSIQEQIAQQLKTNF